MKYIIRILIFLAVFLSFASCSQQQNPNALLIQADSFMEEYPDSALHILESIETQQLSAQADRAYYALLLTQARDKNYIVQTDDSLIRTAVQYYDSVGDVQMQAKAYYYKGAIYRDANLCGEAIKEYLTAIPFAEKAENTKLLGLIYNQAGYLYYLQDLLEQADSIYQLTEKLAIQQNDTSLWADALSFQGKINIERGMAYYPTAEERLLKAFEMTNTAKYRRAAELKSEHPLAGAIVTALQEQENIVPATLDGFESITGKGIKVTYQGAEYWAGSHKLLKDYHATLTDVLGEMLAQYESDGCSIVYFGRKDELLAIVAIKDQIKATSAEAVRELRTQGIEVYMLTGDGERTASAVAGRLGNIQYIADALPDDKEEFVRQLQLQRKTVAMVGDGINDSQALACADVSIAMGKGTDIAMDVAMVTLMTSDLLLLPKAFNLSRQTVRLIHQNLFWAFIYNLIGIPIAAGLLYPINGLLLNPMLASAAMAFSSVSVVLNSLRLRY